ncbi:hypothetical protein LTR99_001890 [Exophiala xenobiotica]|uniref:Uncharacterized protein n=1 Tax=Vermiconidia calcicola TaxID=1690605 RepID=A0AAV9Q958_9PEZI|nr:hypothetical protein LTR92_004307 [Exophiala xenobiotica]KAK5529060.1 hypothetical protein LTR23_010806 [Chaetothyriales sp. CCFEE 6169]KAK5536658.1 hypothetical protein LTR25_005332 [Vermiconidia calcicola]KAK5272499.1 hypothetical protein LTR96_002129 [Exophiala xenobiotica]KAK5306200.1 hypothetical protein LTR99_001890 [Exophiala xenobiotica]
MATDSSVSNRSSISSYHPNVDLDLDLLFARLDKYTAEMEEVEARLRRARSASITSSDHDSQHSYIEVGSWFDNMPLIPPGFGSRRASSLIRRSLIVQQNATSAGLPVLVQPLSKVDGDVGGHRCSQNDGVIFGQLEHRTSLVEGRLTGSRDSRVERDSASSSKLSEQPVSQRSSILHHSLLRRRSPTPPRNGSPPKPSSDHLGSHTDYIVRAAETGVESSNSDLDQAILLGHNLLSPAAAMTSTLPPRTSSKSSSAGQVRISRGGVPLKTTRRRTSATAQISGERAGTFGSDQTALSARFQGGLSPVPTLSHAGSSATLSPPRTPMSICSPHEDQLRRELESFALQEGAETLALRYKKRKPPILSFADSDDEHPCQYANLDHDLAKAAGTPASESTSRPQMRRRRSILSIFQRRSSVEKLIDMYLDEGQKGKPTPRRTSSMKSKRDTHVQSSTVETPPIPPLPH